METVAKNSLKKCPRCSKKAGEVITYPATTEYFHRCKTQPDGLSYQCKQCRREIARGSFIKHHHPKRMMAELTFDEPTILPRGYKRCANPYCNRIREITEEWFTADNRNPDGHSSRCKRCQKITRLIDKGQISSYSEGDKIQYGEFGSYTADEIELLKNQIGAPGTNEFGEQI